MASKQFREDLYYRINTVKLHMPPLREHKEDIPALASHFINRFSAEQKKGTLRLSKGAERRLLGHDWPGNIRELKNAMEAAVALAQGPQIDVAELRIENMGKEAESVHAGLSFSVARQRFEQSYFQFHFENCDGNISEISRKTGVDRKQIYKKLHEYNIVQRADA